MTIITMMNPACFKVIEAMFIMMLLMLHVDLVFAEEVRCIEKEREALLQFKASLVDEFGSLSSWGDEEDKRDCCQWDEVGCSNQTNHVQILDVGEYGLTGKISTSLMELQHLKSLNLHSNNLEGPIPYQLGNLSKLQYLDFRYNNLEGPIPYQLGNLSMLQYLDLSSNYLTGPIPYQLGNLSMLQYLDLSSNYLTGPIPYQLGNLSMLQYLDLSSNYLTDPIPYQLGNLSMLQCLDLNSNYLTGPIPCQLGNLSMLRYLDLSYNRLEGALPSQLGKLSSLQTLFLGFNSGLEFDNENHIGGQWMSNLTSLIHLDLSEISHLNNSHSWLQMIGKLPKLTELILSHCSLSDNFFLSLGPSKFKFSTSLLVLDLSSNTLKSSIIFQWLLNVSCNLVELNLQKNLLEGPILDDFGFAMNSLSELDLSYNRIKVGDMKSLMSICTLRSLGMRENNLTEDLSIIVNHLSAGCVRYTLQELDLSNNQITGTLPDLSIFPSLKILELQENQLRGKIPKTIRLPSQFESLDVDSNSLEGGIPKSIGNACNLRSLILSNNSLNEELPMIMHHMSGCARYSLQEVYLNMNQINGTLPDLSIFPSLKVLHLNENRLNGKVLENIRFPPLLETLNISSNSLKGVIIDSHFANMSKLKELDLANNSLTLMFSDNWVPSFQLDLISLRSCKLGPAFPKWLQTQIQFLKLDISNSGISDLVPEWFWALSTRVFWMDISHNNLKGTIPNGILWLDNGVFSSRINLAANQFEGPIPSSLRSVTSLDLSENKFSDSLLFLCANDSDKSLRQLDLSNNHLSGQIPDCWNNFKSLAYLDLSNNNFSGQVPSTIGSALELQVLILRNNSLNGELPFSFRSCTKLVMLDVGENKLSGLIPSWIGSSLQQLQMLSLRRNYFYGSLSLSLCYLTSIHLLDLSSNNLKGQIPKCFKNFSAMAGERFSVDDNRHAYHVNESFGIVIYDYDVIALLMWKGVEHMIKNDNLLYKGIDLSSNQLTKEIPSEIENLVGLVLLNLSRNNLTGEIPLKIGRLTSLEFLDLSRNQLDGSIPSSLIEIDRLTMLDLSHNYLSGEIPTSTQLQSFNASSYEDNLDLCGMPLQKLCKEEESSQEPLDKFREDEDAFLGRGFYISVAVGFVIGFWGIFGSILVKRSWRHAYFVFLNNLMDNIYVMIAVKVVKFKRRLGI